MSILGGMNDDRAGSGGLFLACSLDGMTRRDNAPGPGQFRGPSIGKDFRTPASGIF